MNYADISDEAAAREQHMIEVALANRQHPSMPFPVLATGAMTTLRKVTTAVQSAGKMMRKISELNNRGL